MTPITNQNVLDIEVALREAEQDVALLERLSGAEARVKALTADLAKAKSAEEKATAARVQAAYDARFADLSDIRVIDTTPDEGVLRSGFTITYTRTAYDMDRQENVPSPISISGFGGLPDNVFAFLQERHPDRIPEKIMSLAPGDPTEAFNRYFRGLRRGYVAA